MFLSLVLLGGMAAVRVQACWHGGDPGGPFRGAGIRMTKFGNHPPRLAGLLRVRAQSGAGRAHAGRSARTPGRGEGNAVAFAGGGAQGAARGGMPCGLWGGVRLVRA
ncbi:hypothetical protein [Nitratidesulfovibrio termitidis]|uniref:hypothetical protein n=1 Tax=Nitratidesulfovibrio termitidis TaxID=42252 RepID=UPI0012EBBCA3|nr:hypothetical protein [Nitratidesulfovibrio termitidis]